MNIKLQGYVQNSFVREGFIPYGEDHYQYGLDIDVLHPSAFTELEEGIEALKLQQAWEMEVKNPQWEPGRNPDRVFVEDKSTVVRLSSIQTPKLSPVLENRIQRDEDLMKTMVEVLGTLRILKDGNVYVTPDYIDEYIG